MYHQNENRYSSEKQIARSGKKTRRREERGSDFDSGIIPLTVTPTRHSKSPNHNTEHVQRNKDVIEEPQITPLYPIKRGDGTWETRVSNSAAETSLRLPKRTKQRHSKHFPREKKNSESTGFTANEPTRSAIDSVTAYEYCYTSNDYKPRKKSSKCPNLMLSCFKCRHTWPLHVVRNSFGSCIKSQKAKLIVLNISKRSFFSDFYLHRTLFII